MAEFSLGDVQTGERPARASQAVGVIERLSDADAVLAVDDPFIELSTVGEDQIQIEPSHHGRKSGEAKAVSAPIAFEQLQHSQEKILGPSIVARPHAGRAEVEIPRDLELNIWKRLGNSLDVLAKRERFRQMTSLTKVVAHVDEQLAESPLIAKRPRQPSHERAYASPRSGPLGSSTPLRSGTGNVYRRSFDDLIRA